jgi:hypothetical protein
MPAHGHRMEKPSPAASKTASKKQKKNFAKCTAQKLDIGGQAGIMQV